VVLRLDVRIERRADGPIGPALPVEDAFRRGDISSGMSIVMPLPRRGRLSVMRATRSVRS
jgi:hypothetical protein